MAIWLVCYGQWYNAQEVSKPAITSWETGDSDDASAIFSFATHRCPAQGGIST
ncbi:hypothetical protein [Alistipes sp. An116]|uniref:hypothetical protein n=1 Tax=Alistipes sp. An116 TaxID=1965546 RepID=UPI001951377A|nr:hypothetical protein [Alistipes sp. An116]